MRLFIATKDEDLKQDSALFNVSVLGCVCVLKIK